MDAPSPFKQGSTTLEQAFGLKEAAFCAISQLSPDASSERATPPPSDGSMNVFEKQDPTTPMDRAVSAPALKRSRHSSHTSSDLRAPHRRFGRSLDKSLPQKMPHSKVKNEQSRARKRERSSSEERGILPQHHNAALCVC